MNPIANCQIDPERLASLAECLETYGIEEDPAEIDWPHNVISTRAVAYSCGAFCCEGSTIPHHHDAAEWELCTKLAAQAANMMTGIYIGMGDEGDHELSPFYVIANQNIAIPTAITELEIRSAFGGTIYPQARIEISSFQAGSGAWWEDLQAAKQPEILAAWQQLIAWFQEQPELVSPVFVEINLDSLADGHSNYGCVFPRLILGLTKAGSLVGLSSCVVHT